MIAQGLAAWLAASPAVFVGLTLGLFGGCAWLAGQGAAEAWKNAVAALGYATLLTIADRFLVWALFGGRLWSVWGFLVHGGAIALIALLSYRLARARRMVAQYPWLFERAGPFGWRARP